MNEHIPGVCAGRTNMGAVVSIGIKPPGKIGFPIEKDMFHILDPIASADEATTSGGKVMKIERRGHHAAFGWFHKLPKEHRQLLRFKLAGRWEDTFSMGYRLHQMQGVKIPGRRPWCSGDGTTAQRWGQAKGIDGFNEIKCPGDNCQYRKAAGNEPKPCKLITVIAMQLAWTVEKMDWAAERMAAEGLDPSQVALSQFSPIVRFQTGSIYNATRFLSMRDDLDRAAASYGLAKVEEREDRTGAKYLACTERNYNPRGYPFTMRLVMQSGENTKFPTVSIQPEQAPGDFIESYIRGRALLDNLLKRGDHKELPPPAPIVALTMADIEDADADLSGGPQPGLFR